MRFLKTKQEAFFSNPKKYDILFESIKSFAVRHLYLESASTNLGNSKIFFQTPFEINGNHLTFRLLTFVRLDKWRTAKLLIDSNSMSYFFGFEENASCFIFKNRKGHPVS